MMGEQKVLLIESHEPGEITELNKYLKKGWRVINTDSTTIYRNAGPHYTITRTIFVLEKDSISQ